MANHLEPVAPPGLEREIMRRLPPAALGSTLAAAAFSAWAHWFPIDANAVAIEKYVRMVDAMAAG